MAAEIGKVLAESKDTASLVNQSFLTSPDEQGEAYILTPEEEEQCRQHEITQAKKWMAWRWANRGAGSEEVLHKLSQFDFDAYWVENKHRLLSLTNSRKHQEQWHQQKREREKAESQEREKALKAFWTAKRMYDLLQWSSEQEHGKKLIVNHNTMPLIRVLCYFLSGDPRFESELGYSFSKGLWIRGNSGLGKTHLVECLKANVLNPVVIHSMLEVAEKVKSEGEYVPVMGNARVLYLDDVGTEEVPVNYYGTKINWFKDFIELYYSKKRPYNRLMLSTNISFDDVQERYGYRVRSRAKEMFNIVNVDGEDLRG